MPVPISTVITNRALCPPCIARKVGLKPEAVEAAITVMTRGEIRISRHPNGTCTDCGNDALVFAIDRP